MTVWHGAFGVVVHDLGSPRFEKVKRAKLPNWQPEMGFWQGLTKWQTHDSKGPRFWHAACNRIGRRANRPGRDAKRRGKPGTARESEWTTSRV